MADKNKESGLNPEKKMSRSDFLKAANIALASLLLASCVNPDSVDAQENTAKSATSAPTKTAAPTETPTPTEIPAPEYPLVPDIENFREAFVPEEELVDGSYWNWLNEVVAPTLLEDFKAREDQIRDDIPIRLVGLGTGSTFFYPNEGVYANEEITAPWDRKVTFAVTNCKHHDGRVLECMVLPVFYYDKETQQIFPVVTIQPLYHEEMTETIMDTYLEEMNMPLIVYSSSKGSFTKENINMYEPLVMESYKRLGQDEVWERVERFWEGDVSAFSSPDMLVRGTVASGKPFH